MKSCDVVGELLELPWRESRRVGKLRRSRGLHARALELGSCSLEKGLLSDSLFLSFSGCHLRTLSISIVPAGVGRVGCVVHSCLLERERMLDFDMLVKLSVCGLFFPHEMMCCMSLSMTSFGDMIKILGGMTVNDDAGVCVLPFLFNFALTYSSTCSLSFRLHLYRFSVTFSRFFGCDALVRVAAGRINSDPPPPPRAISFLPGKRNYDGTLQKTPK